MPNEFGNPFQRADVQGKGLPATACADDLLWLFDALGELPANQRATPVRTRLGFKPGGGPLDWEPNSWMARFEAALWPDKDWPELFHKVLRALIRIPALVAWLLGYFADFGVIA